MAKRCVRQCDPRLYLLPTDSPLRVASELSNWHGRAAGPRTKGGLHFVTRSEATGSVGQYRMPGQTPWLASPLREIQHRVVEHPYEVDEVPVLDCAFDAPVVAFVELAFEQ